MKHRVHLKTIGAKFTLLFILMALVLCLGLCGFSAYISWEKYTDFYWQKALEAAKLAASYVDGDKIGGYLESGETDAYYEELTETLSAIKREQKLAYLYIFVPSDDHFNYVLDIVLEGEDPAWFSSLGDRYDYTELEYEYLVQDVADKTACRQKIVVLENFYGPGVSAWAPVLDSEGNLVAMVEADLALDVVVAALSDFLKAAIVVCCTLVLLVAAILMLITRKIVARPIARLTENVQGFVSDEGLSFPTEDIQTGDEMQTLSEAFGKMTQDIRQYTRNLEAVAADKERIETELSLATDIQVSLLPRKFPAFPNRDEFDIYATMQPAKVVGGDFYDYFLIDKNRLGIVLGGVSGHGIPAALFMVVAKTIIKNQMMMGGPIEEAMSTVNARLYESSTANTVVRAFVGVLDIPDGRFTYINAGQRPPLLMQKEGTYEFLNGQEMTPLAEIESVRYRKIELTLRQGDKLVLYSGGVTAAQNSEGTAFSADRLRTCLNARRNREESLREMVTGLCSEVTSFVGGATQQEDITALALAYYKTDRVRGEIVVQAKEEEFYRLQQFLKRQLEENGLGGAFYAHLSVSTEEAFALVVSRQAWRGEVLAGCTVDDKRGRVTVSLAYPGPGVNPFENMTESQRDAVAFIRRSVDELQYRYQEGRNIISLQKAVPGGKEDGTVQAKE